MSGNNNRRRKNKFGGKSFIILPIIFFIRIYLVIFLAFGPTLRTLSSAFGMFFFDTEKDYSTDYENIFVPLSEDNLQDSDDESRANTVDIADINYPSYGAQFGELIIEDCKVDAKLFFGDGDIALKNGVGVFNGSFVPGYGKTILVAGHNNTYFNGLKYAEPGQIVAIKTSYGNYEYEITDTAVKKAVDPTAYDLSLDYENLVMYTCYPFDELGLTEARFFVYAKYISGPEIVTGDGGGKEIE